MATGTNVLVTVSGATTRVTFDRFEGDHYVIAEIGLLDKGVEKTFTSLTTKVNGVRGTYAIVTRTVSDAKAEIAAIRAQYGKGEVRKVMQDVGVWDLNGMMKDMPEPPAYDDEQEEVIAATPLSFYEDFPVIANYSVQQAVEDGVLTYVFQNRWPELTGGKPIVATIGVMEFSDAARLEIWNDYVMWSRNVAPNLKEEDRLFSTTMNSERIWVIEDRAVFTMLLPEEY